MHFQGLSLSWKLGGGGGLVCFLCSAVAVLMRGKTIITVNYYIDYILYPMDCAWSFVIL